MSRQEVPLVLAVFVLTSVLLVFFDVLVTPQRNPIMTPTIDPKRNRNRNRNRNCNRLSRMLTEERSGQNGSNQIDSDNQQLSEIGNTGLNEKYWI